MRQLPLIALIVLLAVNTASAFSIDWGSLGNGKHEFWGRMHSGQDSKDHDYGDNDPNKNCSDSNDWNQDDYDFFGHRRSDSYDWNHSHGEDAREHVGVKFFDWKDKFESHHERSEEYREWNEYAKDMEDSEWMIGKHEWYLEHKKEKVDWLCNLIEHLEEKLRSCQEDGGKDQWDDVPEKYQTWIEKWHGVKEHLLTKAIDWLAEKKSHLEEHIEWHSSPHEDLSEISYTAETSSVAEELLSVTSDSLSSALLSISLASSMESANSIPEPTVLITSTAVASSVPEPTASVLAALGLLGVGVLGRRTWA